MLRIVITLILMLAAADFTLAQSDTAKYVTGKLEIELRNGKKLPAAHMQVVLTDTARNRQMYRTVSACDGHYFIGSVPAGKYILEAWLDSNRVVEQGIDVQGTQIFRNADIIIPAAGVTKKK